MKFILYTIFFIFIQFQAKATLQIPDILILNRDTMQMLNYPFNKHIEQKLYKEIGQNNDFDKARNTGCWRGYRAEWQIIDKELYLSAVYSCDLKARIDITKILEGNYYSGLLKADCVTDKVYIVYGNYYKLPTILRSEYTYEFQSILDFKKGRLMHRQDFDNCHSFVTVNSNPNVLRENIVKNINWKLIPEDIKKLSFSYELDSLGYLKKVNFISVNTADIKQEIYRIFDKIGPIEAIYQYDIFTPLTYFIRLDLSDDNKKRYL